MSLDLDFVRSQFSAFAEPSLQGQAFFENAGGSYTCQQVIDRLTHYYRATKVQPYGAYDASRIAGEQMDASLQGLARYLGVTADEVHIGPSTSQNTYVLAQAFVEGWQAGDEIIVTNQDHEANGGAWRRLADRGIVVREWQVNPETGALCGNDLSNLLNERTRLVTFPHCSNIVAHINPVKDWCNLIHQAGAMAVVDGVSAAGHGFPDVGDLGADVYLFSLYKTFGPHQGVMVIRCHAEAHIAPQSHYFNSQAQSKKYIPAGPDHAQVAASQGVIDYFDAMYDHHQLTGAKPAAVAQLIAQAEKPLLTELLSWLDARNDLRILGPTDASQRAATVAIVSHKKTPQELAQGLAKQGIMAGAGHFYAVRLLEAMEVDPATGVLRLSFVHYTSPQELQQLLVALDKLL